MPRPHQHEEASQAVREGARASLPDWYLAALLAAPANRQDLVTLAAFLGEVARIPPAMSEPALGDIRLAWWRETIESGMEDGALSGSPVADAIASLASRLALPRDLLLLPLEGHARTLEAERLPDEAAFTAYLAETWGAAFRLAVRVLGVTGSIELDRLCRLAGEAYGRAKVALELGSHIRQGRLPLPLSRASIGGLQERQRPEAASVLRALVAGLADEARGALAEMRASAIPGEAFAAFLPLALVEPYLRALESPRYDPLCEIADISPLARVYRLWRAKMRRRI